MDEQSAADRDDELAGVGEVGLRGLAGPVRLGEAHLLGGAARGAPGAHVPLPRTQLARLVAAGVALVEQGEQGLGLEGGRVGEPPFDLGPVLGEGIFPRPPVPRGHEFGRQLARGDVLTRAVLRSIPARCAARPMAPCLVISCINVLPCVSLTGRTGPASPPLEGRLGPTITPPWDGADVIVVDEAM